MKKLVAMILVFVLSLSAIITFAANTEIIINGNKAAIPEDMGKIVMQQDRNFVPIRFLMENFGFYVEWIEAEQTIVGRHENGESFIMQVGNAKLFYFDANGTMKDLAPMDVTPFLNEAEGRVYVPLRFIAEAMGYDVGWDDATETVTLTK